MTQKKVSDSAGNRNQIFQPEAMIFTGQEAEYVHTDGLKWCHREK
jgi:hypothetical protein